MMLTILTTHPIQYQVPLWQALARDGRVPFEVWYLTNHGVQASQDREFGKSFAWDLDMLSGYPHRFLDVMPGATPNTFWKCRTRESLAERLRVSGAKALWIQGWQVAAYWQAAWAARQAGVAVWLRGESNGLAPTPFWKRGLKRALLGQLFRRVDRFLYIGTANRRLYEKFGVPASKLHPAPYAVDNERFARQAESLRAQRSWLRAQWNIPDDAFCVLFCGKFIPKKRPMDLVEAARLLSDPASALRLPASGPAASGQKPVVPNVHLLFVGSGELGEQLRAACHVVFDADFAGQQDNETTGRRSVVSGPVGSSLSPRPRATFAGFLNQTEISKAYVSADCLVLPSDYGETWGLVVNEAMASGLPCVISDQCGSSVDLGDGLNQVFSCGDVAGLAGCLVRLAGRENLDSLETQQKPPSFSDTIATIVALENQPAS